MDCRDLLQPAVELKIKNFLLLYMFSTAAVNINLAGRILYRIAYVVMAWGNSW
jgi:hypothetical protein